MVREDLLTKKDALHFIEDRKYRDKVQIARKQAELDLAKKMIMDSKKCTSYIKKKNKWGYYAVSMWQGLMRHDPNPK